LARGLVFHELKDAEESFVAHVADAAIVLLHGLEARSEITPLSLDVGEDLLFLVEIEISDGSGATNGMAAVGKSGPEHVRLKVPGDGIGNKHGAEGKVAARQAFGAAHNIRTDAVMLRGKPFAGAAESTHDFVVDQQNAVFIAEGAEFRIVIVGWNEQTVGDGDALHENR